jgi:hypothetical protein
MHKFQEVLKTDFIEYNSRPYKAYTLKSMLNLVDFAADPDLQLGARALLDYDAAKFAFGNDQGRHLPPYRRHRHAVLAHIYEGDGPFAPPTKASPKPSAFFYCCEDTDFMIPSMMFFTAQTQQIKGDIANNPGLPTNFASPMLVNATSTYVPENLILDMAISPPADGVQQIHNAGLETYSRGPGYLITAGGISSGPAYSSVMGIGGKEDDSGAGVETTLLLTDVLQTWTVDLIHFRGPSLPTLEVDTFDNNTCIWKTFACGTSLFIPDNVAKGTGNCLTRPAGAPTQWYFMDTAACSALGGGQHLYIVIFRADCPSGFACGFKNNYGFFELYRPKPGDNFADFQKRIVGQNPITVLTMAVGGYLPSPGQASLPNYFPMLGGVYHSANGDTITFDAMGNQADSNDTGIEQVNGVDQPKVSDFNFLAKGDFLNGGDGRITIGKGPGAITYDLSNLNAPKRSVQ